MLWASEYQADQDITLFDMDRVKLVRLGDCYSLSVPGLAEGRPSVLKGDVVIVKLRKKKYLERVRAVQLLTVSLEFRPVFHRDYDFRVDQVDVRFAFSRTTFRTSHFGCEMAPTSMGQRMLYPRIEDHKDSSTQSSLERSVRSFRWANRTLNREQQLAVENM